ncbi:MAG: RDD family protein [Bdellovibrionaceae bacterium]|nr:RDD family protein [Pseudobdellovibrionaceae bacterium]
MPTTSRYHIKGTIYRLTGPSSTLQNFFHTVAKKGFLSRRYLVYMVLPNPFQEGPVGNHANNNNNNHAQASTSIPCPDGSTCLAIHPLQRVLAFVVDFFLWLPILKLIFSQEKSHLFDQLIENTQVNVVWVWELLVNLGMALLFTLVVYALLLSFFGTTPGLYIFQARIINQDTKKYPTFLNAFFRGFFLFCSLVTLGIPLLLTLSHSRRLAFHDLATDTYPIGPSSFVSNSLFHKFRPYIRAYSFFFFSAGLWIIVVVALIIKSFIEKQQVTQHVHNECFYHSMSYSSPLESEIIGFLNKQSSNRCLLKLISEVTKTEKNKRNEDLVYFAHMLLNLDEPDLIKIYKKQLCQKQSRSCHLWKLWTIDHNALSPHPRQPNDLLETWLTIRYHTYRNEPTKIYELAKALPDHPVFNELKLSSWMMYHEAATNNLDLTPILKLNLHEEQAVKVLELICDQKLARSCNTKSIQPCRVLLEHPHYFSSNDPQETMEKVARGLHVNYCSQTKYPSIVKKFLSLSGSEQNDLKPLILLTNKSWQELSELYRRIEKKLSHLGKTQLKIWLRIIQATYHSQTQHQLMVSQTTAKQFQDYFGAWLPINTDRFPAHQEKQEQ